MNSSKLQMIIPVNPSTLLSEDQHRLMEELCQEAEWMLAWVLNQWPAMLQHNEALIYDQLYTDLEGHINAIFCEDDEEPSERAMISHVEENIDKIFEVSQTVYQTLHPFIGDIPCEPGLQYAYCDTLGRSDMVITFDRVRPSYGFIAQELPIRYPPTVFAGVGG